MRFLIVDDYYPAFLKDHYDNHPDLKNQPYDAQMLALMAERFGTSDFYSRNLRALGYEALDLIVNARPLQIAWAKEHSPKLLRQKGMSDNTWHMKVVEQQVLHYRPDVLYFQNLTYFGSDFVFHLKNFVRLVLGQCACPLDWNLDFNCYDLILTSFPHYVELFEERGIPSAYLQLAFEPSILGYLGPTEKDRNVVFVGGISSTHRTSLRLLEKAAAELPIDIFGYGTHQLPANSAIQARHRGRAWGLGMYRELARSRISLNRHIDVAGRFANNMRLYETTGVGTCLVTDSKHNLGELFAIDEEVVTYESPEECVEKIIYLLRENEKTQQIARAGQKRTLRDHTYHQRMEELAALVRRIPLPSRRGHQRSEWKVPRPSSTETLKSFVRRSPFGPLARKVYRIAKQNPGDRASTAHALLGESQITDDLLEGWKSNLIPARQRQVVDQELREMYHGDVVPLFRVAASAIATTGLARPKILDIGCASGYYYEALNHLVPGGVNYLGVDFSPVLVRQAVRSYPGVQFLLGDATALPFRDACCDVVFSSGVIMHIANYSAAIKEIFRTSSSWCVFHRTPVLEVSRTTHFSKKAYGVPVLELVFNEDELRQQFAEAGGRIVKVLEIDRHSLPHLDEPARLKTYVCRRL